MEIIISNLLWKKSKRANAHDGKYFPSDIEKLSITAPTENDYRQQVEQMANWQSQQK